MDVAITILKIRELAFSLIEEKVDETGLSIGFSVETDINFDEETFEIKVNYSLKSNLTGLSYVQIKVSNLFRISNLKDYSTEDKAHVTLPHTTLITMLSLSISHTRALLAKNTAGTTLEQYLLPIVNPTEIAKQIFKIPIVKENSPISKSSKPKVKS